MLGSHGESHGRGIGRGWKRKRCFAAHGRRNLRDDSESEEIRSRAGSVVGQESLYESTSNAVTRLHVYALLGMIPWSSRY